MEYYYSENLSADMLKKGQKAIIKSYAVSDGFTARLKDLGLVKGMEIEIYLISPFGSPVCIKSQCGKLLLRKKALKNIFVRIKK